MRPAATFVNNIYIYIHNKLHNDVRCSVLIVIFTRTARSPAHNYFHDPFLRNVWTLMSSRMLNFGNVSGFI
jgi:hypothetical protein